MTAGKRSPLHFIPWAPKHELTSCPPSYGLAVALLAYLNFCGGDQAIQVTKGLGKKAHLTQMASAKVIIIFTNYSKVRNSALHQEQHFILNVMLLSLIELLLALGLSGVPIKVMGILSLSEERAVFAFQSNTLNSSFNF